MEFNSAMIKLDRADNARGMWGYESGRSLESVRGVRYEKTLILRKLKGIQPPKTRVQKKAPAVNQLEPLKGLSNYLRKESLPLSNALIAGTSRAGWPGMPISFNLGLRGASDRNQLRPGSTRP